MKKAAQSGRSQTAFAYVLCATFLCTATPAFAAGHWLDVADVELEVSPGNALDFSELFERVDLGTDNPATKRVRTTAGGNTSLNGATPHRFMCAAINFAGPWGKFPDEETAERIAVQLRRHGYNIVRMHHTEGALMEGVPASPDNDLRFNATQRDRFYNFLRVLKAHGIHWMLDMMSDDNAAWGMVGRNRSENTDFRTKLSVHYDPAYQAHWKGIVNTLFHQDYDGDGPQNSILTDPALASVLLANELSMVYNLRKQPNNELPDALKDLMIAWALTRSPPVVLTRNDIPPVGKSAYPNASLLHEFLSHREQRTAAWMKSYVEALSGSDLLVSAYNNGKVIQTVAAKEHVDAVNMHAYHDADGRPFESANNSSFSDALGYVQVFAANRYLNKPFIVDEYDIPYWNKWRREAGIALPAYAALQGWDGICRYSNPITLRYQVMPDTLRSERMYPFSIGMDPIARAGETLAALLFRRGDVSPAQHAFTVNLPDSVLHFKSSANQGMPSSITRMALLSKIAIKRSGSTMPLAGSTSFTIEQKTVSGSQRTYFENHLNKLKALSPDNATYMGSDVEHYVSDTGEIVTHIEQADGAEPIYQMRVRTPRTEAYVFQAHSPPAGRKGDRLIIENADTDALVSLSSLDKTKPDGSGGESLTQSDRLLLIVATDALNSNAVFSNDNRERLIEMGDLPVRLEAISLQLSLRLTPHAQYVVYPLNLNGDRRPAANGGFQTIATQPLGDGSGFMLHIDTAALGAPTTFFELRRLD
ncbi:MAG TPA: hypothetical protein VJU83_12895 [Burkholderiales bacterium]|nr:hypothetical protein [Burkholderiales bacterium]